LEFTKALNVFYKENRALWELDHQEEGIEILDADNSDESILLFMRKWNKARDFLIVYCNFTPVERHQVRVGVPYKGSYMEIWNTECKELGGTWVEGQGILKTNAEPFHQITHSVELFLPAMSVIVMAPTLVYGVA